MYKVLLGSVKNLLRPQEVRPEETTSTWAAAVLPDEREEREKKKAVELAGGARDETAEVGKKVNSA